MWILVHLAMVWPPIEMKKMNCKGHVLVVSKNQESRATANDNPNYRVLFRMEKDVSGYQGNKVYLQQKLLLLH
jgi:hypothetical protein